MQIKHLYPTFIIIMTLIVVVVLCNCNNVKVTARSAQVQVGNEQKLYDELIRLSPDSLLKMARRLSNDPSKTDSTIVCLNFINDRYHQSQNSKDDAGIAIGSNNILGNIYMFEYGDFPKAYYHLQLAKDISEENGIEEFMPSITTNLGALYQMAGSLADDETMKTKGLKFLKDNFHNSISIGNWRTAITSFLNIGSIALSENNIDAIKDELSLFRNTRFDRSEPHFNLASHFSSALEAYNNGDIDKALHEMDSMAAETADDAAMSRYQLMILTNKYCILREARDYIKMLQCLDRIAAIAEQTNAEDVQADVLKNYAELYELKGDTSSSQYYELKYHRFKESLDRRGKTGTIQNMETYYVLEKVNSDMRRLMERAYRQRIVIVFSAALLLMLIGFIIYVWRNYQRLKASQHSLYETNLRLLAAEKEESETRRKYAGSSLTEDDKDNLMFRIKTCLETSEEIYAEGFTIDRLSELVHSRARYVSQVINEKTGKTFPQMLAEAKVLEACRRLNDIDKYGNYTTEAIGEEVGFRSRTNFIATFKRFTGLTPAQYRKTRIESTN